MAASNTIQRITSKLSQTIFSTHKKCCSFNHISKSFFSTKPSSPNYTSDIDELPFLDNSESHKPPLDNSPELGQHTPPERRSPAVLEGGLDLGIYKAVIVGQVGQNPVQKTLKNGRKVTLTTVGTGGIRNERIPFPSEEPREFADHCNVQWHRVSVYPDGLAEIVMKHAQPGVLLYLEGNIETKIFNDPITGIVRRIREIAVRRNGRIVFLGNDGNFTQSSVDELRGVGYF